MNAGDLWSGNDYAHTDNISRGVSFYERANRVKVMRVFKQEGGYGRERATTMVDVIMCRDDGTPKENYGKPYERTVRARDIFMRWDEYERERKHRKDKAEEIERERQNLRIAEEQRKERILVALESKGIDRLSVTTVTDYHVSIRRNELESWLGLDVHA